MINGILYEKYSSSSINTSLDVKDENYFIKENEHILSSGKISNLIISSRLGNVQRKITLEDGRLFSTNDNDLVDKLLLNKKSILHRLESNLVLIFSSLVFIVVIAYFFIIYGIPNISKKIAFTLPASINKTISDSLLTTLDKNFLHPSYLDEEKQNNIKLMFEKDILSNIEDKDEFNYKLHIRNIFISNKNIANAFALPNGDIIITDALIRLAKNKEELKAVLYHEIGHIKQRHSLQKIIEGSFIAFVSMYLTGDVTLSSNVLVGFGSLYINTKYSRGHETQADEYALDKLLKNKINPKNLSTILNSLTQTDKNKKNGNMLDMFSTHPRTEDRDKLIKRYEDCFKQDIYPCKVSY